MGSQTSKAHAHAHVPQADGGILGARRKPQKGRGIGLLLGLGLLYGFDIMNMRLEVQRLLSLPSAL